MLFGPFCFDKQTSPPPSPPVLCGDFDLSDPSTLLADIKTPAQAPYSVSISEPFTLL